MKLHCRLPKTILRVAASFAVVAARIRIVSAQTTSCDPDNPCLDNYCCSSDNSFGGYFCYAPGNTGKLPIFVMIYLLFIMLLL